MAWSSLSLVTDADLGALEPEAIAGTWGAASWPTARDEAVRDLRIWLEADYPEIPDVADRIRDQWRPSRVWSATGGVWTDRTTEASSLDADDLALASVFATPSSDALYVGLGQAFEGLFVRMLATRNSNASTLTASYWGPTGWTSLGAEDGTKQGSATFGRTGRVSWAMPIDWELRELQDEGIVRYWVRLTVSAALSSGTAAGQILPIRPPTGLRRVATYLALAHVCRGLAPKASEPAFWTDRAAWYHDQATALYARLRSQGGIPIDLDGDASVSPPTEIPSPKTRSVKVYRAG
jgi:hypothetical protein